MPRQAIPGKDGKWPGNVKVEYLTPKEREAKIAQAPPGAGGVQVPQAPGTITTQHFAPNTPEPTEPDQFEQQAQAATDQVVGRAAISCARQLGLDFVRSTQTKKKITLDSAEQVCRKNPGLIYFNFDDLEEIEDDPPDETIDEDLDPTAQAEPGLISSLLSSEETPEAEAEPEEVEYEDPKPRRLTREQKIAQALQTAAEQEPEYDDRSEYERRVPESSRRAWGGTLSTPGIQVYIRPQGVVRVDVTGRVRLQKGISGNVRTMRIQALEPPQQGGIVRNVSRRTVTGEQSPSPNPAAQHRHGIAPPINPRPAPKPRPEPESTSETATISEPIESGEVSEF